MSTETGVITQWAVDTYLNCQFSESTVIGEAMNVQKDLGEHKYWPFKSLKDKKEDEAVHLPNPLVDGEFIPHSNSHCIYLGNEQLVMCILSLIASNTPFPWRKRATVEWCNRYKKKLYA